MSAEFVRPYPDWEMMYHAKRNQVRQLTEDNDQGAEALKAAWDENKRLRETLLAVWDEFDGGVSDATLRDITEALQIDGGDAQ